jgi:hypothetical protein
MSNNAIAAYDAGLAPASKIQGVPAALVRQFRSRAEWHHTSKAFNRTDFYDPAEVRATFGLIAHDDHQANPEAVAALAKSKAGAPPKTHSNCRVEWIEWSGSLKRSKATEHAAQGCTVIVKGQTATITLPGGATLTKRLTTNGFRFQSAFGQRELTPPNAVQPKE